MPTKNRNNHSGGRTHAHTSALMFHTLRYGTGYVNSTYRGDTSLHDATADQPGADGPYKRLGCFPTLTGAKRALTRHSRAQVKGKGERKFTMATKLNAGGAASSAMTAPAAPDLASPESTRTHYKLARTVAVFHISQAAPQASPAASPSPAMLATAVPS